MSPEDKNRILESLLRLMADECEEAYNKGVIEGLEQALRITDDIENGLTTATTRAIRQILSSQRKFAARVNK